MATILIVDDIAVNRELIVALLAHGGHESLEASDGLEALALVRARRPQLVISDILMPTMDGYEFVRRLREDPGIAHTPVIFYTAHYREVEARNLAAACGVSHILLKPSAPEEILTVIAEALRDGSASKPAPVADDFEREHLRLITDKLAHSDFELRASNHRLSALTELNVQLASEREPQALLDSLCRSARDLIGASYAILWAREKNDVGAVYFTTSGLAAAIVNGLVPSAIDHGILGTVLAGRRPCRVSGLTGDARAAGLPPGCPDPHMMLAAPIASLQHVYGWICLVDKVGATEFSNEDERMLLVLGAQVGRIYENGSLYAHMQKHAARLAAEVVERTRAEQSLRESEAKYRELIEQASDGIFITDAQGVYTLANSRFCAMLGYRDEELIGANATITYVESERAQFAQHVVGVVEHGDRLFERTIVRRDGTRFPVEVSIHLLRNGTFQGIVRDITSRKKAEQALAESEQRFRQLAENIREVFWLTDPSKNEILYVSPGYERTWGRSRDRLYESPMAWVEAIHLDDRERALEAARTKQAAGKYDERYRIVRPDGTIRWIRDRAFPVRDPTGKPFRIAGIAEDITDAMNAGEELRESQRRFSDMLSNLDLVALMLDSDARITYVNDYLLKLTGRQRDEVTGKNWFNLFLPPEITAELQDVQRALIADSPLARHYENEILTASGERRLIHWNNTVLRSMSGEVNGSASIGEDITERKRADERVQRLNRVYAMLSGIDSVIVRERDREALFREACRIAVDAGAFRKAWIATVDPETGCGSMTAWFGGAPGDVDRIQLGSRADSIAGGHPASRALRELKPVICDDTRTDPMIVPWRDELLKRNNLSLGCFPLLVGGRAVAVLALFAGKPGNFDDEEMRLLRELTGNISFALEHIEKQKKLDYLAYYDTLTGLPNRNLFRERLIQHIRAAGREHQQLALIVLDIERFGAVNEMLGRQGGDEVLQRIAERGRGFLQDSGQLGRLGIDQFAFVIPDLKLEGDAARSIEQWDREVFGTSFRMGESEFRLAAKFGAALFPGDGLDADALLKNAEAALKRAKAAGQRYLFYTQQITERIADRMALENRLHHALVNEEFVLHYQPKVDLETGRIAGVEALIRWISPKMGIVSPMEFIPLMEESGMILEVGAWVIRKAAGDYRAWVQSGLPAPRIAVNVSPVQMRQKDFVRMVTRALDPNPSSAGIDLELTESLVMEDIGGSIEKLNEVRTLGISIAIDDFGTGYSSLAYLAKLPVQALKIDRSFIAMMLDAPDTMALVGTIISLAHSLRMKVIAEGVEKVEQARMLRLLRCDEMQGYLFSRPVPFEAMTSLLKQGPLPIPAWR